MKLQRIVEHYIRTHRARARREMKVFAAQPSFAETIRLAALCNDVLRAERDSKNFRHSHQRRIPRHCLIRAERLLLAVKGKLRASRNFDELHEQVSAAIGGGGIGPLTIYDVTHRIGAYLKLHPKLVYLHSGTAAGARHIGIRGQAVAKSALPREFEPLSPAEIEDCLCIYKDMLSGKIPLSSLSAVSCGPASGGCRTAVRPVQKC
jgi:hypothetical protein